MAEGSLWLTCFFVFVLILFGAALAPVGDFARLGAFILPEW